MGMARLRLGLWARVSPASSGGGGKCVGGGINSPLPTGGTYCASLPLPPF